MTTLKVGLPLLGVALLAAAWYAFRPEKAFIDRRVGEAAPSGQAAVVASGRFAPLEHEGRGTAQILLGPDGRHTLRFSDFATLDGPDVRVYLLGAESVTNDEELGKAGYLDLGALRGNVGDQNYDIPAGTDLSRYRAVSVWCRRFGVNFTAAVLTPSRPTGGA